MSLYQKYRPKNFTDVVGQEFVKQLLSNSCKTQTFHHGYIFFGFHGIGKTTLARIFSQAVNCTNITDDGNPCHECENCKSYNAGRMIDVIEIDAASYTGVDNIREIIDHAKFTPTQGKYKVYIIDEVHMLSKGAFNALLKTLEEPPAHAIFLLATTEIHKVPDTILSRVIRFDLERIGEKDMHDHLVKICTSEGIQYEESAIKLITHRSRGSLRDALTMLEKCIFENTLTAEHVEKALHLVNQGFIRETVEACISGEAAKIQYIEATLRQTANDVRQFASQVTEWIVDNLEEALQNGQFVAYKEVFDMFTKVFVQSRQVAVPMDVLTMALYEKIKTGKVEKITPQTPPSPKIQESEKVIKQEEKPERKEEIKPEITEPSSEKEESTSNGDNTNNSNNHDNGSNQSNSNNEPGVFSAESFLSKASSLGLKSTLLPLLRTATIRLRDGIITVQTTDYAKNRCTESAIWSILSATAESFEASLSIESLETKEEGNIIDIAASVFS